MKPLINLKSFLAVLLILIVSCSLLLAYFRNFVPGAGGHQHDHAATGDDALRKDEDNHAAREQDTIPNP
jgi:hypothetical protein